MRQLADLIVELQYVDAISRRDRPSDTKKKRAPKPSAESRSAADTTKWIRRVWLPRMEQVLDIYKRPYHAQYPVVCMDESPRQLIRETRTPVPACPEAES